MLEDKCKEYAEDVVEAEVGVDRAAGVVAPAISLVTSMCSESMFVSSGVGAGFRPRGWLTCRVYGGAGSDSSGCDDVPLQQASSSSRISSIKSHHSAFVRQWPSVAYSAGS
jgi:hypothetical protein